MTLIDAAILCTSRRPVILPCRLLGASREITNKDFWRDFPKKSRFNSRLSCSGLPTSKA